MRLRIIPCVVFCMLLGISCGKNQSSKDRAASASLQGNIIYKRNCMVCHGTYGTLGVSGASDLSHSTLDTGEKVIVITEGRKNMPSFRKSLSPEQIRAVAAFTETLKK